MKKRDYLSSCVFVHKLKQTNQKEFKGRTKNYDMICLSSRLTSQRRLAISYWKNWGIHFVTSLRGLKVAEEIQDNNRASLDSECFTYYSHKIWPLEPNHLISDYYILSYIIIYIIIKIIKKKKQKQLQLYDLYIHNTNTALDIAYNF